ncbi:hypothetical protein E3E14_07045 [Streptomyces sp. ICN441]|nr:hypothetical protein E3E14_07045 [Streptomyces sp. ICN441]
MGNTFSPSNCKRCGEELAQQHTGRPGEYCGTKCRQAAHRDRRKAASPDTEQFDAYLRAELVASGNAIQQLLDTLDIPGAAGNIPLRQFLEVQRSIDQLTVAMVGRARQCGEPWEIISTLLGMTRETARRKYAPPVVHRALNRTQTHKHTPRTDAPAPNQSGTRRTSADDRSGTPSAGAERPGLPQQTPPCANPQDLASVLSSLQRASGQSLRALGARTGLSPSFLSRLMNGERFPTWRDAAAIARACGADPVILRKVWEDAEARRGREKRPHTLASALRYLHMRAGRPTPWAIATTSGTLSQDHVTGLLEGTAVYDWEHVERLVQVLDGEPSFFRPLWEQTAPTPQAWSPAPARKKTPRPQNQPKPTTRAEELLCAFSEALGKSTPSSTPRRALAAPIQAATHWPGR